MNVKEFLRNYRKISVQITMAEAVGRLNDKIAKLIEDKAIVDKAIEFLNEEEFMAVDGHYRQGQSFEIIARKGGYAKSTVAYRCLCGLKVLQNVLDNA